MKPLVQSSPPASRWLCSAPRRAPRRSRSSRTLVTGTIAKAAGTAKTLPVSARSTAFINFLVSFSGLAPDSVTAARLVIFLPRASATGTLSIQNLTSSFTETIAGRSIPTPTIDTVDLAQIPLRGDYFISDITAQVKAWLTTSASEFGIAITSDGVATAALASKEGAGSGHPAFIEVDVNRDGGPLSGTTLALTSTAIVNGNLGIGLMNPAKPLHVLADGSPDAPFGGPGPSGASTDIGTASAVFDRNGHNTVAINAGDGRFSQLLFGRPTAANNGSILYNDFGDFGITFSTKQGSMTLTNSGKFGIGTTTPTSSLDVRGASGTLLTLSSYVNDVDQAQGIAFAIPATVGTKHTGQDHRSHAGKRRERNQLLHECPVWNGCDTPNDYRPERQRRHRDDSDESQAGGLWLR